VVSQPPAGPRRTLPAAVEIVVPARNEELRLPQGLGVLCAKAAMLPVRTAILVVDNASTDGTADVVRNWPAGPVPVRLISCGRPGKGRAVQTGLLATQAPFVGFCDADMATGLAALEVTLSLLRTGHLMVIASRALDGSVTDERHSGTRRLGAAAFRALARQVVPGATDTQCGFKFFSGPLARAAARSLRTGGFAFDIELIAACQRLGATLTEIPVDWRDVPGSTFSVSRHSAAALRDLAAIWLRYRPGRPGAAAPAPSAVPVQAPAPAAATPA